jgi:hypothetical protein
MRRLENQWWPSSEIPQYRYDRAARPALAEQFAPDRGPEGWIALTGTPHKAGAEIVLRDDVQPNTSGCGNACLRLDIVQLLVDPTPAGGEPTQEPVQDRRGIRKPARR